MSTSNVPYNVKDQRKEGKRWKIELHALKKGTSSWKTKKEKDKSKSKNVTNLLKHNNSSHYFEVIKL